MSRIPSLPVVVLPAMLALGIVAQRPAASTPMPVSDVAGEAVSAPGNGDETARSRLLGVWEDDYQGKRTMTLDDDGTGTMLVELGGAQALLFASKLRFDMEWSFEDGKLTKRTVGGEPELKVNLILRTMGDTATDTLLELTDDRMLLLDKDGKTHYDWRRPARSESK